MHQQTEIQKKFNLQTLPSMATTHFCFPVANAFPLAILLHDHHLHTMYASYHGPSTTAQRVFGLQYATQPFKRQDSTPPTPARDNFTEAYFSAEVPLEGDRTSDVESLPTNPNSTSSSTYSLAAVPKRDDSPHEKDARDKPADTHPAKRKAEGTEQPGRKRTASDILLRADLRDIAAMSALSWEMGEKKLEEEEKARILTGLQTQRESEREAAQEGSGRYEQSL